MAPTTTNELGFDEVVDTLCDAVEAGEQLYLAAKDGFQIGDIATLLTVAPKAQEIARDGKTAYAQFVDLNPDESDEAVEKIATRLNLAQSGIRSKIQTGLRLVTRAYRQVDQAIELVGDFKEWGESLRA